MTIQQAFEKFITWAIRPCEDYPAYVAWILWVLLTISIISA